MKEIQMKINEKKKAIKNVLLYIFDQQKSAHSVWERARVPQ